MSYAYNCMLEREEYPDLQKFVECSSFFDTDAKGSKELSPTNTVSGSSNFRKEKNSYHSCFQQTLQAGIQEAD